MNEIANKLQAIKELNDCKDLYEAKEVITNNRKKIGTEAFDHMIWFIDRGIYTYRFYGVLDKKYEIPNLVKMLLEDVEKSLKQESIAS